MINKSFFIAIGLGISSLSFAQQADQIIVRHIVETGGAPAWKNLTSVYLKGNVSLSQSEVYPVEIFQQRPDLKKTIISIKGKKKVLEGYDGKKGYGMNYATNNLQVVPDYKVENFDSDLLMWKEFGFIASLEGSGDVDGNDCYIISLTKNKNKFLYFIDKNTYQLLKEDGPEEILYYSNYKKIKGLSFPFKIVSQSKKKEGDYSLNLQSVETNKAFPPQTFKF